MSSHYQIRLWPIWTIAAAFLVFSNQAVIAGAAEEIEREAGAALTQLYLHTPVAKKFAEQSEGILVFPSITKAGLVLGGQYGKGVLRQNGRTTGYYRSTAVSYGLQAGAQKFGYVLFLMTADALEYLEDSNGWEIGVGPSVVIVDEGVAKTMTTTTAKDDIYAFIFGQKGLMAGIGLQGSRIKKIDLDD